MAGKNSIEAFVLKGFPKRFSKKIGKGEDLSFGLFEKIYSRQEGNWNVEGGEISDSVRLLLGYVDKGLAAIFRGKVYVYSPNGNVWAKAILGGGEEISEYEIVDKKSLIRGLNVFLNKKFDIIISADALEHVKLPKNYFNFIRRHLKSDGTALITFPNESKEKHHGITWFDNKKELMKLINEFNFEIIELKEVRQTFWHKFVKNFLWNIPKSIIYKSKNKPQVFEDTKAFQIVLKNNIKTKIFSIYAEIIKK